jgi:ATP dependent DNA ligase domain
MRSRPIPLREVRRRNRYSGHWSSSWPRLCGASSSIGRTNDRLPILTILASGSHLDHGEGDGRLLFEQIAQMDLEGIVCKRKDSPYKVTEKPSRHWIKVKNSRYSQLEGRGVV